MPVDNVFKFVNLRPADRVDPARVELRFARYDAEAKTPLHQQIEALDAEDRRAAAIVLALAFMASEDYLGARHPVVEAVEHASRASTAAEARGAAAAVLGAPDLEAYLSSDAHAALRVRLWDSLYAQALAPRARPDDRSWIFAGVRASHYLSLLVWQCAEEAPLPLSALQEVTPIVPPDVIPPARFAAPDGDDGAGDDVIEGLVGLHARVIAAREAIDDLRNVERLYRAHLTRTLPTADAELLDPDQLEVPVRHKILTRPVLRRSPVATAALTDGVDMAATPGETPAPQLDTVLIPAKRPWVFETFGEKNLKPATLTLLESRRAAFEERDVAEITAMLEAETAEEVTRFLASLPARAVPHVAERAELRRIAEAVPIALPPFAPLGPDRFPAPGSPAERGIRPLGMGDLLVVQQELRCYAPGELAHVENVLQGEHKLRRHTRTQETEELLVVETEEREETERDLQSTERFELQRETEQTIESEMRVEAGLSITASYGFVSATATAEFAYNQSRAESSRLASQFAKEIVERSVSRVMRRVREERRRRTLERVEELNEHGLDNRSGTGHVIGVYRWLDKYYKARIVNYGRRLMMEFIVPQPSAFYIHAQSRRPLPGVTAERPEEPTVWGLPLRPDDLTRSNYQAFVAEYNARDVPPPPPPTIKVGAAFAEAPGTGQNANVAYAKTAENLVIPDGYQVTDVYGLFNWQGTSNNYFARCYVAGSPFSSIAAHGLRGKVPISVMGWMTAFHVNVVADCELTDDALQAWRLKAYQAIITAYEQALSAYNEQVAAAAASTGVAIQGRNPEQNRKIERDELRKGALRLLTDEYARIGVAGQWRFNERFDAMRPGDAQTYPEFDVGEALVEGQIIQFFEQAFEWENMTYRFYPYFWGRRETWKDTFQHDDPDPLFTDFLRAGAARVVVPVHPAYTESILYYLQTNEIWSGDRPPTLDDPLYVSIVDEIRADTKANMYEPLPACAEDRPTYPCVVDEWEVKVPTSLVYLQPTPELPPCRPMDEGGEPPPR